MVHDSVGRMFVVNCAGLLQWSQSNPLYSRYVEVSSQVHLLPAHSRTLSLADSCIIYCVVLYEPFNEFNNFENGRSNW